MLPQAGDLSDLLYLALADLPFAVVTRALNAALALDLPHSAVPRALAASASACLALDLPHSALELVNRILCIGTTSSTSLGWPISIYRLCHWPILSYAGSSSPIGIGLDYRVPLLIIFVG